MTLLDNRGDFVSVGYRYTRESLREINLYLKASLTSSIDAVYILRRNLLDRKTIESTYGVKYRRQCWQFEVNVTSGEYDRTVMAYISLLGLGGGGGSIARSEKRRGTGGCCLLRNRFFFFIFFKRFFLDKFGKFAYLSSFKFMITW